MNHESTTPRAACSAAVAGLFQDFFDLVDPWAAELGAVASDAPATAAEIDAVVEPLVLRALARTDLPVAGAGFVAAHHVLADADWHMAWWQGPENARLLPKELDAGPAVYSRLEWFRVPFKTGRSHITGPYVDYLCTDEYTMTQSTPVFASGNFIGIAGADIYVGDVEKLLLPYLRELDSEATLVNHAGRVIVSANPHLPTGKLLIEQWEQGTSADFEATVELKMPGMGYEAGNVYQCADLPVALVLPQRGTLPSC